MREKRKSEKAIFEAKDLVILNSGFYNVLDKGRFSWEWEEALRQRRSEAAAFNGTTLVRNNVSLGFRPLY